MAKAGNNHGSSSLQGMAEALLHPCPGSQILRLWHWRDWFFWVRKRGKKSWGSGLARNFSGVCPMMDFEGEIFCYPDGYVDTEIVLHGFL